MMAPPDFTFALVRFVMKMVVLISALMVPPLKLKIPVAVAPPALLTPGVVNRPPSRLKVPLPVAAVRPKFTPLAEALTVMVPLLKLTMPMPALPTINPEAEPAAPVLNTSPP